jgi:hypothetical protein
MKIQQLLGSIEKTMDLNRVYFPLRSNVGWFRSLDLREQMTSRVKESLLVHDELIIEDGTFVVNILDEGGMQNMWLPPGMLPQELRTVEVQDLRPDTVTTWLGNEGEIPNEVVLHGRASLRFKIDYYNIFRGLDLSSYDFIKVRVIQDLDLPGEAKQIIHHNAFEDRTRFQQLEANTWLRDLVINNLNRDLVVASLLGSGIVLDSRHGDLLRRKHANAPSRDPNTAVVRHLISVAAPNFADMPLEQVIEVRHDRLWTDFRAFVSAVVAEVTTDPDVLSDPRAFDEAVARKIERALFEELQKRYPRKRNLVIDLGLGLAGLSPWLSIPTTLADIAKSVYQYWGGKGGWHAFLMKLDPAH